MLWPAREGTVTSVRNLHLWNEIELNQENLSTPSSRTAAMVAAKLTRLRGQLCFLHLGEPQTLKVQIQRRTWSSRGFASASIYLYRPGLGHEKRGRALTSPGHHLLGDAAAWLEAWWGRWRLFRSGVGSSVRATAVWRSGTCLRPFGTAWRSVPSFTGTDQTSCE